MAAWLRHAPQQLQVVLGELLAAVLRVELDDAERPCPSGGAQRHAHDRADAEVGDALAQVEPLVGRGVLAEEGAWPVSRQRLTMLRLKRAVVVRPPPGLDHPRMSLRLASSRRMMKPRSACLKT